MKVFAGKLGQTQNCYEFYSLLNGCFHGNQCISGLALYLKILVLVTLSVC